MDEQVLLSLSDQELYRVFLAKKRDLKENKNITESKIKKVRYGVNILFSFSKYFKYKDSHEWGLFRQKPKSNTIRVDSYGYVDMDKFNEELEERNAIMLNALLDYYGEDDDIIRSDTDGVNIIKRTKKSR